MAVRTADNKSVGAPNKTATAVIKMLGDHKGTSALGQKKEWCLRCKGEWDHNWGTCQRCGFGTHTSNNPFR